ncbi:MAG: thiamine pyrophosphate-dependent dehydrogenase E1 component subunit alpha [Candidatus Saganbacteria bacterium]|nr:thiamine pyrophosphate-dependent dehydrogenase E1 component subunit alpha [Candidatus Saganbacteria bacterium]
MDKALLKKLYYEMLRIRLVEENLASLYSEQEMRCPVHLCAGQEAIAVGVCANLKTDDYVMSNHRSHGHFLAKGGNLNEMMAEIYGKETGCCHGKGGSMHLVDLSVNYLGSTPIVAGTIPVGTGVAFGTLLKGEKKVTVVFLGDAATEEGVFYESLNFASLKKLPVLFVSENNFYSVYSPLSVRQPHERDNLTIAKGHGVYSDKGTGNDVLDVYRVAEKAIKHIRDGKGPAFICFDTYRFREHCGPNYDNKLGYRLESEYEEWRKRCPVVTFEKKLLQKKDIDQETIDTYKNKIQSEMDEAVLFAKNSPFPKVSEVYTDVYAEEKKND